MSLYPKLAKERDELYQSKLYLEDAYDLLNCLITSDTPLDWDTYDSVEDIRSLIQKTIYSMEQHLFEIGEKL